LVAIFLGKLLKTIMTIASLKNAHKLTEQLPVLSLVERSAVAVKLPLLANSITEPLTGALLIQLLDSLATATTVATQRIESLLTQLAQQHQALVLPYLLQALLHASPQVQSTSAMVLIRLGSPSIMPLRQFYASHQYHNTLHHSVGFVLDQLSVK
jgi:hypothetical protein